MSYTWHADVTWLSLQKQLVDHYDQVANDNRRLYDPAEDQTELADTAQIIEEQIKNLRASFFDDSASDDNRENCISKPVVNIHKIIRKKHNDFLEIDDRLISSIDFNCGTDDACNEIKNIAKVDLTEKMCQAFGSNINDVGDDFEDFILNCEDEMVDFNTNNAVDNQNVALHSKTLKKSVVVSHKEDSGINTFNFGLPQSSKNKDTTDEYAKHPTNVEKPLVNEASSEQQSTDLSDDVTLEPPAVDLDAPIVPQLVAASAQVDETKELEDWLDSVLDD